MSFIVLKNNLLRILVCLLILQSANTNSQQKFEVIKKNKNTIVNQIKLLREEAAKLHNVDNAQKAINKLEHGLELYNKNNIKDNTILFGLYVDLSNTYSIESVRNEAKTLEYVNKAKSLAKKTDLKTSDLINFYISLGANKNDESKYEEALGYINIAYNTLINKNKKLISETGFDAEKKLRATLLEWFVSLNFSLNKEDELLYSHKRLEHFFNENNDNENAKYYYALGSFRVGRFYQNINVAKAEFYFNRSEEKGDKNIGLYSIICKGFAFLSAKEYKKVPKVIKKLEAFKNLNMFQELNLHEIAARYYSETQNIDKLIIHSNKALTLLNSEDKTMDVLSFKREDFTPIIQLKYPILLNQFAQFLEQTKHPKLVATSSELFRISLKQFDERIDRKPVNNHLANYDIIRNRNLKWLIATDAPLNIKQNILSQMERIDNRAALNRIAFNRALANNKSVLDDLLAKENKIREEITLLKQKQIESDTSMNQQLFELELHLKELNNQLIAENPTFFGLNSTEFDLSKITLDSDTKIIKYLKTEDILFRIVISNSNIFIKNLGKYKPIEDNVLLCLKHIKNYKNIDNYKKICDTLYRELIGDETLSKHTIIITDASLRYLSFELLTNNNEYLIEKTAISYSSGLSYLNQELYNSKSYEQNITLFAPSYQSYIPSETELTVRGEPYDLKGATEEVNIINDIICGVAYQNENASKSQFFNLPNNTAILHLAGHAFLNDKDPELSNIIFSDIEEDNKLYISELYGFKSNAELAVLSACNTGVGGYDNGNGIVSLSQAFMYSGIPSTVSSLWSAPDNSTKDIMVNFYSNLSNGLTKSSALRNAKLDYLKQATNPKLKHPYYWAGFVLYGNDAPLVLNKPIEFMYYLIFGFIALLALGLILRTIKKRPNQ